MFNPEDVDALNAEIAGWNRETKAAILSEMDKLDIKHSDKSPNSTPLRKAFGSKLGRKFDLVNKIAYTMPRSAVFLHKGVGRGHPISNPREAKEWFNPVIDEHLDELGNIVADGAGTLVINAVNIR